MLAAGPLGPVGLEPGWGQGICILPAFRGILTHAVMRTSGLGQRGNFSVKGQTVSTAGFEVYSASVVTSHLCGDRNAATGNM